MANTPCGTPDNPCICLGSYAPCLSNNNSQASTCSCSDSKCLTLGNIIVSPKESVAPCQSGTVPFDCFNYCGCDSGTTTPRITEIKGPITVDNINAEGLDFTINADAIGCERIDIFIEASCGRLSDVGCITIFVKDLCEDMPTGCKCDYKTGEYVCTKGGEFDAQGPHPTVTTNSCLDPVTYTVTNYDTALLENVSFNSLGEVIYSVVCDDNDLPNTTIIEYIAESCGATMTGQFIVNINLCAGVTCGDCQYCRPCTGECTDYPSKTLELIEYTQNLVEGLTINTNEEVAWDSVICSDLLPTQLVVNYEVVECGVTELKSQTFDIECPDECCDCKPKLVSKPTCKTGAIYLNPKECSMGSDLTVVNGCTKFCTPNNCTCNTSSGFEGLPPIVIDSSGCHSCPCDINITDIEDELASCNPTQLTVNYTGCLPSYNWQLKVNDGQSGLACDEGGSSGSFVIASGTTTSSPLIITVPTTYLSYQSLNVCLSDPNDPSCFDCNCYRSECCPENNYIFDLDTFDCIEAGTVTGLIAGGINLNTLPGFSFPYSMMQLQALEDDLNAYYQGINFCSTVCIDSTTTQSLCLIQFTKVLSSDSPTILQTTNVGDVNSQQVTVVTCP